MLQASVEEGKIRGLTGKELAEDCVGLIIKSLASFSEIIYSFLFRKFLLKSWGLYICIKNIRWYSRATLTQSL